MTDEDLAAWCFGLWIEADLRRSRWPDEEINQHRAQYVQRVCANPDLVAKIRALRAEFEAKLIAGADEQARRPGVPDDVERLRRRANELRRAVHGGPP